MSARSVLAVATPLVAVATLALGMRVGAGNAVRAAVVVGAPPSAGNPTLYWQVRTLYEDTGVRESVALPDVEVRARLGDRESVFRGATNGDGVLEAALDVGPVRWGDAVEIEVRAASEKDALARGVARWPEQRPGAAGSPPAASFLRPNRREGAVALDVALEGQTLAVDRAASLWVRATDRATGAPARGVVVEAEGDQGLRVDASERPRTCDDGWTEVRVSTFAHLAGVDLRARDERGATGAWYGPLPVTQGAESFELPARVEEGAPARARVVAPPAVRRSYVEVRDATGRAYAQALALRPDGDHPVAASAAFDLPGLRAGSYWLVSTADPGLLSDLVSTMAFGAFVRPFVVVPKDAKPSSRCVDGPALAMRAAPPSVRFVALDGFDGPGGKRAQRERTRRRGLAIALGSLAVAAILETILLLGGIMQARRQLAVLDDALEEDDGLSPTRSTSGAAGTVASVVVGLLLVLLGFGLLAAFVTYRGS